MSSTAGVEAPTGIARSSIRCGGEPVAPDGWHSGRSFRLPSKRRSYNLKRFSTPSYFQTMGIPLLKGRIFSEQDILSSGPVVVN